MASETDIAWLAGIIDGEGCFSVKRPIVRKSGKRRGSRTTYQVWLVLCNTSEAMVLRATEIMRDLGAPPPSIRKVWKGKKATRWQYWLSLTKKHELLKVTEAMLPHLTAKRTEAEIVVWFLRRACAVKSYSLNPLDRLMLEALSPIKRNGGEAPADLQQMIREVIPNQAVPGHQSRSGEGTEGVETRSVSPNDNPIHECPAALRLVSR